MSELEQAIAWGMQHGFCDEAFANEYRAQADDPAAVNEFIGVMAIYAKCLYPPSLDNKEVLMRKRELVNTGMVPRFFASYLGV